jgi:SAM-dependent methyltransferase
VRVPETMRQLEPLHMLAEYCEVIAVLERHIRSTGKSLTILEAGCGRSWPLKLEGLEASLTGIDLDPVALRNRRDLARAIVGDVRDRTLLAPRSCDVVYSSFVLEHVEGAEQVLENFLTWLRPGGLILLRIPDGASAYGFATRFSPFWLHVLYKRWIAGMPNAGKPGFDPYPVYYDPVVSRRGLRDFCHRKGCSIVEEHGSGFYMRGRLGLLMRLAAMLLSALSFGRLSWRHNDLTYVIRTGERTEIPIDDATRAAMALPALPSGGRVRASGADSA